MWRRGRSPDMRYGIAILVLVALLPLLLTACGKGKY
jgi:hypothetical protein